MKTLVFGTSNHACGAGDYSNELRFRCAELPQVEVQEDCDQNHEHHPPLKHFGIEFIVPDLLVSLVVTQALRLVEHDLIDLLVELPVVGVIAPHGQPPNNQPEPPSQNGHDDVQNVIGFLLLGSQYKQFLVHWSSLSGVLWVSDKNTNVSIGVSPVGVFTIGVHATIILGCNQIRI